jgi:hypothetical protein
VKAVIKAASLKRGTTMKSSIRTFVVAAVAAASLTAFPHRATAQMAFVASTNTKNITLPADGIATLNAITLPKAGTYVITGQQSFLAYPTATAETPVMCWTSTQAGGDTPLTDGPYAVTTIAPPSGYATLPLNGYLTVTEPTTIWVQCIYWGTEVLSTFNGSIAATQVK